MTLGLLSRLLPSEIRRRLPLCDGGKARPRDWILLHGERVGIGIVGEGSAVAGRLGHGGQTLLPIVHISRKIAVAESLSLLRYFRPI